MDLDIDNIFIEEEIHNDHNNINDEKQIEYLEIKFYIKVFILL